MNKKRRRSKRSLFVSYSLMLLCGLVSLYVFLASFETTFNFDIPVVDATKSIDRYPLQRILSIGSTINQTDYGNYGKPTMLRVPSHDSKVILAPIVDKGSALLGRANTAHFQLLSSPKSGNLGSLLVYMNASWRTDSHPEKLSTKDNLFIDTDRDWRYFYRIDAIKEIDNTKEYVMRDSNVSQIIFVTHMGGGKMLAIEGSFVNVQNVRL